MLRKSLLAAAIALVGWATVGYASSDLPLSRGAASPALDLNLPAPSNAAELIDATVNQVAGHCYRGGYHVRYRGPVYGHGHVHGAFYGGGFLGSPHIGGGFLGPHFGPRINIHRHYGYPPYPVHRVSYGGWGCY